MTVRLLAAALLLTAWATPAFAADVLEPASRRFTDDAAAEVPDFQRHVLPLLGRQGCNGRACHGSFQGQGGFRLSLFGYDFKMDHDALLKDGSGRVDVETPELSKMIAKPTLMNPHKGGKRLEVDTWQYRLLVRWIEAGARGVVEPSRFERLEVVPPEVVFQRPGQKVSLRVVAHWADGTREDVTCLTRFRTNDEAIAEVDADGVVTSLGAGDTHVVAFYDNGVAATQVLRPVSDRVGPNYPDVPAPTTIDALVVAKLRKLGIVPSDLCTDAEFLRRVSLDLTGTLPTPGEVEAFLADVSPRKREQKVDELLSRPTYAAWWTTKLCDITGNSPRNFQGQVAGNEFARHWYEWVYRRVDENLPYDQLIAGIVLATSRKPGQSYEDYVAEQSSYYRQTDPADFAARDTMPYYWGRRNLRKPDEKALNFSYAFLGVRLECAQCHKHPFDQWTQDDFNGFTAFFNTIGYGNAPDSRATLKKMREELGLEGKNGGEVRRKLDGLVKQGKVIPWQEVFLIPARRNARAQNKQAQPQGKMGRVVTPKVLGGEAVQLADYNDPRAPLMEWMRRSDNPYFARAFINRVWANYFGRGIVNPPDDMNLANPPSNEALLEHLAEGFIAHSFDMKWLHREIVTSQTYQRSWRPNETNRLDERNFSRAVVRRLPAEVLIDAVGLATADTANLALATTTVADRAIGPKFGAAYGRRGNGDYAARVFGRSTRDTNCDCSASNEPNLLQSIYLQNDQDLLGAIDRQGGWLAERTAAAARAQAPPKGVAALVRQVEVLEERIKTLRDDGKTKQVERLSARLAALRDDLRDARANEEGVAPAPPAADRDQVVRQAYLRVLGRPPDDREAEVARAHCDGAADPQKGLRDLLWALLNTKEFVTNH